MSHATSLVLDRWNSAWFNCISMILNRIPTIRFKKYCREKRCPWNSKPAIIICYCRAECLEKARELIQALSDKLYELPATVDKVGRLVTLPPPTTRLPREKPVCKDFVITFVVFSAFKCSIVTVSFLVLWYCLHNFRMLMSRLRFHLQPWWLHLSYGHLGYALVVPATQAKASDKMGAVRTEERFEATAISSLWLS